MKNEDLGFLEKKEFNFKLLFLIFAVLFFSIYTGFLIYGEKGLNTLIELQREEKILKEETKKLQIENMQLQKEYFELKDVQGSKE
jgi:cell division protein FtsB